MGKLKPTDNDRWLEECEAWPRLTRDERLERLRSIRAGYPDGHPEIQFIDAQIREVEHE